MKLGELQQVVFHHHYDRDFENRGNPRTGWTYVLIIRDLSRVLPADIHPVTDELLQRWNDNWDGLEDNKASVDAILDGVEKTRSEMLALLQSLE